jgi:hypothetical protein
MRQKLKRTFSPKRLLSLLGLALLTTLSLASPISAQAPAVTQGYASDTTIQRATIVSLTVDDPKKVEPTTIQNQDRLHGVVVSQNDAPLTLSNDNEKTFVATKGRYEVFVSNENGVVQPGDYIAISRVAGIGTKATVESPFVVGKALTGFDGVNDILSTTEVNNPGGEGVLQVAIGRVQLETGVGANPFFQPAEPNLPDFLQRLSEQIANKPVNPVRIYIGLVILFVTAIIAGVLLFSGVRSGMISIGRNPLSKKTITKSLFQVILTSVIILLLGIFGVYLLLRI